METYIIGAAGGLITLLLGLVLSDTKEIKKELKSKVNKEDCLVTVARLEKADNGQWSKINKIKDN